MPIGTPVTWHLASCCCQPQGALQMVDMPRLVFVPQLRVFPCFFQGWKSKLVPRGSSSFCSRLLARASPPIHSSRLASSTALSASRKTLWAMCGLQFRGESSYTRGASPGYHRRSKQFSSVANLMFYSCPDSYTGVWFSCAEL